MEADWEVEIGGQCPVVDAGWSDFVDLRKAPDSARCLPEAAILPALADALIRLNAPSSPVWTAKCDVWPVNVFDSEAFDPDELDAPIESAIHALACYIDMLPGSDDLFQSPEIAIQWCATVCERLRLNPLRCSRADLVVRQALLTRDDHMSVGVTVYLIACGSGPATAASVLANALHFFVGCVLAVSSPITASAKLQ